MNRSPDRFRTRDDAAAGLGWLSMAAVAVAGVAAFALIRSQRDRAGAREPGRRARQTSRQGRQTRSDVVHVERVTTLNTSAETAFGFWKDFRNFPRFMRHLESVELLGGNRSHWVARAPAGMTVEWDAEIVEQREPEFIAWRTLPNSQVEHSGSVRFSPAPGARGTEVRVTLDYAPPGGTVGRTIAWLFREEPNQQIHEDLRRFKQLVETGEVTISDGPLMWRPGQPAATAGDAFKSAGVQR